VEVIAEAAVEVVTAVVAEVDTVAEVDNSPFQLNLMVA
jgi:hypothetical protein